jgi:hypothetical protein
MLLAQLILKHSLPTADARQEMDLPLHNQVELAPLEIVIEENH